MTSSSSNWQSEGTSRSLMSCILFLLVVMGIFIAGCLPIAFWIGDSGWISLLAATMICLGSGVAAVVISYQFSLHDRNLLGVLLAMGCRLAPPLLVCLWLALNQTNENSFVGFLIGSYLVSLAAETYLSVRMIDSLSPKPATN